METAEELLDRRHRELSEQVKALEAEVAQLEALKKAGRNVRDEEIQKIM